MICTDPTCNCGIVSDSLTVTGTGGPGSPFRLETNAFAIVTSVTRPASPFVGQFIWETDTQRQLSWTGSSWLIVAGAMPAWNLTRVSADAAFSVANGSVVEVPLLHEVEDSDTFHTGTTGNAVIPAGFGGDYIVTAFLQYAQNATGYRQTIISVTSNFSQSGLELDTTSAFGQGDTAPHAAKRFRLEAGATVSLSTYQSSGAALNVILAGLTGTMVRHLPLLT